MVTSYRIVLREIINKYYSQLKAQNRPCIWLSAFVPSEIINCFDVDIFYPESYAAVLTARKINSELLSIAKSLGFNESICSYMRIFNGGLNYNERLPFGNVPTPDALIVTNNQCGTLLLMWKIFSKMYQVPLFVIDFPANMNQEGLEQYTISQIENLIQFLESLTNSKLDMAVLERNVSNSQKVSDLWWELCHNVYKQKASVSIQTLTNNFFFPVVVAHSDDRTVQFLEQVLNQVVKEGIPSEINYKKIYWWGYPLWFSKEKFPDLKKYGAKIIANNYLRYWCIPLEKNEAPIKNLAKGYTDTYLNRQIDKKISEFEQEFREYNIDGVIVYINASCKRDSIIGKEVTDIIKQKGIPTIEIEGDMCDVNRFQKKQAYQRIESLLEMIS